MTILVTGATGFVGRHLARQLLARHALERQRLADQRLAPGRHVRILARRPELVSDLADLGAEVVSGDLTCPETLSPALAGCDMVYHLAGAYSTRPQDIPHLYQVNVQGTLHLLIAARDAGVRRFVHTSTVGTIGRTADATLPDEATPFNLWEASHYVRSKYAGELAAQAFAAAGSPVVIVHPTACVGPEDVGPSATGRRLLAFLRGEWLAYPAGGINFVPVQDVAAGMIAAGERGRAGEHYILGHAQGNLNESAYLEVMARASGRQPPPRPWDRLWERLRPQTRARAHLPPALTANPAKAIQELGMPQSDLTAAFAEAVAWLLRRFVTETREGAPPLLISGDRPR